MIRISNSRENEGRCNACCLREELAREERSVCVCVSVLVWEVVGCVFELIQSVDFWKKKRITL